MSTEDGKIITNNTYTNLLKKAGCAFNKFSSSRDTLRNIHLRYIKMSSRRRLSSFFANKNKKGGFIVSGFLTIDFKISLPTKGVRENISFSAGRICLIRFLMCAFSPLEPKI